MTDVSTLINGYREFYQKYFVEDNRLYRDLAQGQSPKTLIIACSDSRVDPSIITNCAPGDIFVIRNVANLVPPFQIDETGYHGVSAALEFAVRILKVENIVVLGHSNCAGIKALRDNTTIQGTDFIGQWVGIAEAAREKLDNSQTEESVQHQCEKEGILLSLENLKTFPWIAEAVQANQLKLHGWYFKLSEGSLHEYVADEQIFKAVA